MKKRLLTAITVCMLSVSLAACGGSSKSSAYDSAVMEEAGAVEMPAEEYYEAEMNSYVTDDGMIENGAGEVTEESAAVSNRKLIKTVNMDVETKDYDGLLANLESQIAQMGGYIEYLDCYGSSYRHASITARVPASKLDGFVKQIGETANVTSRSESVEDVTLQYVDLDSHTRMLEEEQERLLELLENAATIEDIITIESRLSEVRYQLESMKSQLRTFDNQVDYSTVHINIDEVIELTPVVELTDGERIAQGFAKSVADVLHGIKEFFISLIINIPYIILWGVVIVVILLIARALMKISDKRAKRLYQERQEKIAAGEYVSPFVNRPASSSSSGTKSTKSADFEDKTE